MPVSNTDNQTTLTKTKTKTTITLTTKLLVSVGILGVTGALLAIAPLRCIDGCKISPPPTPLTITTQSPLPSAQENISIEENQQYYFQLQATGGAAPYQWGITSGDLPIGLSLDYFGIISGKPNTVNGSEYHFTVEVRDAKGNYVTRDFDLRVKASNLFRINSTNPLPPAVVGVPYRYDFSFTTDSLPDPKGPFTWTKLSGNLPVGWLTNSNATLLKNAPQATEIGSYVFTMQVVEGQLGTADKETFYLNVLPTGSLTITTQSPLPSAQENEYYQFQLQAAGGVAPYAWELISGDLPIGMNLDSSGILSGHPNTYKCRDCRFAVIVRDSRNTTVMRDFDLYVDITKTLSVLKSGSGLGTVVGERWLTGGLYEINCGTMCSAKLDLGTQIFLRATSTIGSEFIGWSGACSGASTTCTIKMNTNKSVTASFVKVITTTPKMPEIPAVE